MKVPVRGPGRPRKWKGPTDVITLRLPLEIINSIDDIAAETGKSRTDVIVSLVKAASNVQVAKLLLRIESLEEYVKHLEKLVSDLKEKLLKSQEENEKLRVENQALKEENKELKQRIRELEKQLRMSARERRADDLKKEIHEVIDRYSRDGKIKMVELMKRLGYSGELLKHAKEFLEQWFVKEGKVYVSYELGLVIVPHHKFGELAWEVRKLASSSNPTPMEVVE